MLIRRTGALGAGVVAALAGMAGADLIDATLVIREGDMFGARTVDTLNSPFTNGNGQVGFVVGFTDGSRGIWFDNAFIFNSDDALPDVLSGGESTMGISDAGDFIYSPSFNGGDAVYTSAGKLLADDDLIPSTTLYSTFNSRPQMGPDGTAYWVGGYTDTQGGSTQGRMLMRATNPGDPNSIDVVYKTGQDVGGWNIGTTGVGFDYDFSDNGANHIVTMILETGSTTNDDFVVVNGNHVAREASATGQGDNWDNFDGVAINNLGNSIFSGDTDGATSTDEFIAYNGNIALREGDSVDGRILTSSVNALSINENNDAAFIWTTDLGETLFFGGADSLALSFALLSTGDMVDLNNDGNADYTVTDFNASAGVIGPGFDLAEDGMVYVEVDLEDFSGAEFEAIIGVRVPAPGALGLLAMGGVFGVRRRR